MIVGFVILLGLVYATGFAHGTTDGPRGVKLAASITHSLRRFPRTAQNLFEFIGAIVSIATGVPMERLRR